MKEEERGRKQLSSESQDVASQLRKGEGEVSTTTVYPAEFCTSLLEVEVVSAHTTQ